MLGNILQLNSNITGPHVAFAYPFICEAKLIVGLGFAQLQKHGMPTHARIICHAGVGGEVEEGGRQGHKTIGRKIMWEPVATATVLSQ